MALEAALKHDTGELGFPLASTCASGEVRQMPDGRAGVRTGLNSQVSGEVAGFATAGVFKILKSTSVVFLPGQAVWYDPTNNYATYAMAGKTAAGFFLGLCVDLDTVAAATTTVTVDLNQNVSRNMIEPKVDGGVSVKTAAAGAPTITDVPGFTEFTLAATNEAECVDLLSYSSVPTAGDAICEFELQVISLSTSAVDLNVGLASATTTTDADAIANSLFLHFDGGDNNIDAESDDGTTEVAATDTTLDWVAGTPFFVQMDTRDPASCKIYINGARVLSATTFVLTAATGPLKFLFHLVKTSSTATAAVRLGKPRVYRSIAP